jgi:hypothetical protein
MGEAWWGRRSSWLAAVGALVGLLGLFAAASPAEGAHPAHCGAMLVSPPELRIRGVLGVPSTFLGTLRVTAVGRPAKAGQVQPKGARKRKNGKAGKTKEYQQPKFTRSGDLKTTGSTARSIPQGAIKIVNAEGALKKGRSSEVEVTVEGARFVGEYTGAIRAANGRCKIPLTVVVAGPPDLRLVGAEGKTLNVQVVSCAGYTCGPDGVVEVLTRPSARRDDFVPEVDNGSQSPAEVSAVQIGLDRNPGGKRPPREALVADPQAFDLPPLENSLLSPVSVDRDEIDPGHYTGAIYLTLRGAERRVVLPLELDVKSGPFWAIVVLLLALLVQLLVWLAERNKPRGEELRAIRAAAKETRTDLDPEDWALLEGRFNAARELARNGKTAEAKAARTEIEEEAKWLPEVRVWVGEIKKAHDGKLPDGVRESLVDFYKAIERGDRGTANSVRTDLRNIRSPEKVQRDKLQELAMEENAAFDAAQPSMPQPLPVVRFARWVLARLKDLWQAILHPARTVGLLSIYGLPWLLRALLVFVFVLAGLKELYFDNATFGSDPVLNYSALFVWGVGATAFNAALGKVIPSSAS